MASGQDFYDRLNEVDGKLDNLQNIMSKLDTANANLTAVEGKLDTVNANLVTIEGKLDTITTGIAQLNSTMQWGLAQLITIGNYNNLALFHNDQQNDTMICILEHISKDACALVNEAHTQTGLQTIIKEKAVALADLYAAVHPAEALARERLEAVRKQCEECCPPEVPPPVCVYEPCPAPGKIDGPPKVTPRQNDPQPPK
jgi:hypothetical protein